MGMMELPGIADEIELDDRDERERYRIYELIDGKPFCVATTPTLSGVGLAIKQLADDRHGAGMEPIPFGILDGIERRWLSSLWHERRFLSP